MHALALHLAVLAAGYSFTVDGKPTTLSMTSLSGGVAVVDVNGAALWLDEPRAWAFTIERDERGRTTLIRERGEVVGAFLSARDGPGKKATPASSLPVLQQHGLRGVVLDRSAQMPRLPGLQAGRACVSVLAGEWVLNAAPPAPGASVTAPVLPRGLACVVLEPQPGLRKADLPDLAELRHLTVSGDVRLDARWFERAHKLQSLELRNVELDQPQALASLPALRQLVVDSLRGKPLVGEFPALEQLRIFHSGPLSLAGLRAPRLATLELRATPLSDYPTALPSLVTAVVVPGDGESADTTCLTLTKTYPGARVECGWLGLLRHVAGRADRLRVREGGICHRMGDEPVLHETRSKDDLAALFASVSLEEFEGWMADMCCGGPTIELYEGENVVAAMSLQHGTSLRWEWSDAPLADGRLPTLLAKWGILQPLEEWKEHVAARDAELKRLDAYLGLMPASIASKYRGTVRVPFDAVLEQLDALVPEGPARFEQHLRLYGSGPRRWDIEWGLDRQSSRWLAEASVEQLAGFAAKHRADLDAGLARLMFSQPGRALVDEPALAPAVPRLAMVGLSSPYAFPRRRTFAVLGRASGPAARQALRGVLAAPPPRLPEGRAEAPELLAPRSPDDKEVFGPLVSEQAIAALLLAQKKDAASADAIRAFCRSCRPIDASLCKDARLLLDAK